MTPALIAIAGPLNGTTFTLDAPEVGIGRESSNHICVPSASVSRRHCLLRQEPGGVVIRDLDSHNGTFVNGIPANQQPLRHGDLLTVGDSCFRFICQERQPPEAARPVELQQAETALLAPFWLPAAEVGGIPKDTLAVADMRTVRDLSAMLTMASRTAAIEDSESLYWQLLGMIFEIVPAERGAILLTGADAQDLVPMAGWNRGAGPGEPVQVSRTVVRQVLEKKAALMANDVATDRRLQDARSLQLQRVHSLLCAPMLAGEKVLGAIYLDCGRHGAGFDQQHLRMLSAVAGLAALAAQRLRRIESLRNENLHLRAGLKLDASLVGESPALRRAQELIAKVAPSDSTVLLCGESGTGKELAARALHRASPRAQHPFVTINCAAIPETLLESELFGYERGAFTGAVGQKRGQFEMANGGSIFLDEIGELAPALQAKLLRVLQQREFVRLGGAQPVKVDVRLIAATNQDLRAAAEQGRFRKDLFFRLNVVTITMPSLRERGEDISLLANYFLAHSKQRCARRVGEISPAAMACLRAYDWPGNVRELENAIEHAVLLGASSTIMPEDLPEVILDAQAAIADRVPGYHAAIGELKRKLILEAVQRARGNYTEAARILGLHPNYLHRLIRNLDLKARLNAAGERAPTELFHEG